MQDNKQDDKNNRERIEGRVVDQQEIKKRLEVERNFDDVYFFSGYLLEKQGWLR